MVFRRGGQRDLGLQRGAHFAFFAQGFDLFVNRFADGADARPFGQQRGVGRGQLAEGFQKDGFAVTKHLPGFFSGEAEEGRHPAQHGVGELPQRGLGAAARQAFGRGGVQAVFQHIEVKAAQVFGAEQLQLGDHGVEFVSLEVGQRVGLEFGRAGQCPAVDLQHLRRGHGVLGRVKVADVGQQKAQGVADAAVAVHHAGEDFFVDGDVARIVAGGHPQSDDFGAHLLADLLRGDGIP